MINNKLFYKYQRIENDDGNHTIENLSNNQFYFNEPTKFNDPFDCKVNYFYQGKEGDWIKFLKKEGNDPTQIKKDIKSKIDDGILENEGDLIIFHPTPAKKNNFLHGDIHKKNLPKVCCFTETDDNILMWSHYADNHQGICLRFRSDKALDGYFLILNSTSEPCQIPFIKIEYKENLPPIVNMFDEDRDETLVKFLLTKYSDWKYEKEYRMLLYENELEGGTIRYEKEDLEGITFGLKMKPENVKLIYNSIDKNYLKAGIDVNFYEAKEIRGKYNLKIEKINDINSYLEDLG